MLDRPILIVDDSEENVLFLSEILAEHGYRHEVASSGEEALRMMRNSPPALVLLDIMMPRKSGVFVFGDMKRDPGLESIPVIFVTGASQATGVDISTGERAPLTSFADQHTRDMGAQLHRKLQRLEPDGLIEKPIDPTLLIQKVQQVLAKASSADPGAAI